MGLFDKKNCDFCGNKIGLLGNRKLSDGNMCKDCAKGISPYLVGRKQYSVDDMKRHLEYREANKERLEKFSPTRTFGLNTKVHVDDNMGCLLITSARNYREENADLIEFPQVTGCILDINEDRDEIKRKTADGKEESYNPPRYRYEYAFWITVHTNHPWFDQIKFRVNPQNVRERGSVEYRDTERQANDMRDALQNLHTQVRESAAEAAKPKTSMICPSCGATTIPDQSGRCEYCSAAVGG
ncbi:DUF4428 domain-containing protein [Ruminococcaceae bacterium OttesenSCG-928-L11]|nr:DUF4428 domain-containing protein [Ruminococcaceae bacterium OttesenSCG-928-L11]